MNSEIGKIMLKIKCSRKQKNKKSLLFLVNEEYDEDKDDSF